ncbi:hypothetical protein HPC49_29870 [Pyxidicoccus fallax]|uniref:Uncharacterized protein n=1 Tax=Pyxidicoccus fallax TaxID=394095 RepID=A0A848L7S3_9BACT|nr:DUF2071 domain-containing protein [Pyxidicoccus fallax]NMO14312.1 hypothetical protein [Pyxidicoccus fallax]NPC82416.1 hypothetical protein [Pyxidicoccus fallax]
MSPESLAALVALAAEPLGESEASLRQRLTDAGVTDAGAVLRGLARAGLVRVEGRLWSLSPAGHEALRAVHAAIEGAHDPSPTTPGMEECPSVPWLTQVQTHWVEAVSLNYAVEPKRLARLLPAPLEPEVFHGSAWVQVLMSSLRDMRPQGMIPLLGVCFYQVSYRAAVRYRNANGDWRRGGYFVRSETNDPVMRRVGNALKEFKFHEFGEAHMVMAREGDLLTTTVDPEPGFPGGRLVGVFDTRPSTRPPAGSVWRGLEELHEPLVECYDALGVAEGYVYVLTIDREPWNARFVTPVQLYCEYFDEGPLAPGSRLDSVLHLTECAYRWRPLRRERYAR